MTQCLRCFSRNLLCGGKGKERKRFGLLWGFFFFLKETLRILYTCCKLMIYMPYSVHVVGILEVNE